MQVLLCWFLLKLKSRVRPWVAVGNPEKMTAQTPRRWIEAMSIDVKAVTRKNRLLCQYYMLLAGCLIAQRFPWPMGDARDRTASGILGWQRLWDALIQAWIPALWMCQWWTINIFGACFDRKERKGLSYLRGTVGENFFAPFSLNNASQTTPLIVWAHSSSSFMYMRLVVW